MKILCSFPFQIVDPMKSYYQFIAILFLYCSLTACGGDSPETKNSSGYRDGKPSVAVDSSGVEKESAYSEILKKFKPISFDTLKVYYTFDQNDKQFSGKELTLKEAKSLPLGITEHYYGKLSGVYACYQFPVDANKVGLIMRVPAEYESTSIVLCFLDLKTDKILKGFYYLAERWGDAGDFYSRISWLYRTKNNYRAFVYVQETHDHSVEDTADHTVDDWRSYAIVNCMSPKFDTLSENETDLKMRFKGVLKTVD